VWRSVRSHGETKTEKSRRTLALPACGDPHAREREVLKLADVVCITPAFSEAEQDRARAAAARDPRPGRTVLYRGSGPRLWYGSGAVCGSHRGG
jgi:hypothetical protein